jgi:hypothetical protein
VAKRFKIISKYLKTLENFDLVFYLNKKIQMIEDICGYEMYTAFFVIYDDAKANISRQLKKINKIQKKEQYLSSTIIKKNYSFFLNLLKKKK